MNPPNPFDRALAELARIDRECREAHARFLAAVKAPRERFEAAMAEAKGERR